MAKDVITVNGEERIVREDTAKSYRGVIWALISVFAFIVITAILFMSGVFTNLGSGDTKTPAEVEQQRQAPR
ncbi:MAG: hypothetical protein JSS81_16080 [Acidobacteria bacterium]|nr:hypothetical protein [Acidobacteriota bacterium]